MVISKPISATLVPPELGIHGAFTARLRRSGTRLLLGYDLLHGYGKCRRSLSCSPERGHARLLGLDAVVLPQERKKPVSRRCLQICPLLRKNSSLDVGRHLPSLHRMGFHARKSMVNVSRGPGVDTVSHFDLTHHSAGRCCPQIRRPRIRRDASKR